MPLAKQRYLTCWLTVLQTAFRKRPPEQSSELRNATSRGVEQLQQHCIAQVRFERENSLYRNLGKDSLGELVRYRWQRYCGADIELKVADAVAEAE